MPLFDDLSPMTDNLPTITVQERQGRIEKARRLMRENNIDALFLEAGTSLFYYTGIQWWRSERMLGAVIPAQGEIAYVGAGFEEARLREQILFGDDVRVWQEHESPYARVVEILRDRGLATGRIGIEESVRFFVFDGIRKLASQAQFVSADPITIPCRAYKSETEIALMQRRTTRANTPTASAKSWIRRSGTLQFAWSWPPPRRPWTR